MEGLTHQGTHCCSQLQPLRQYTHGDSISLFSLNTACLPKIPSKLTSHFTELPNEDVRIRRISKFLLEKQYDIICLQEMFRKDLVDYLFASLGACKRFETKSFKTELALPVNIPEVSKYNYYAYASSHHKFGKACAGLLILAKFPIRQAHQIKFDAKGVGTDRAARKGFLCVELDVGGYPLFITNTHMQAGYDHTPLWWPFLVEGRPEKSAARERGRQLGQISSHVVLQATEHKTGNFFVCGDLNIKAGSEEYEEMMHILNDPSDVIQEYAEQKSDKTTKTGRVDYILSYHTHNRLLREKRPVNVSYAGVEHVREQHVSDHSGVILVMSLGMFEPCVGCGGSGDK
jgi:endonuclease/exonuclease/phosphatase family metal-dependent hydrolase